MESTVWTHAPDSGLAVPTTEMDGATGHRHRPSYSSHLLFAFAEALAEYGDIGEMASQATDFVGDRVLVEIAHQALQVALDFTRDPDLGLKAARRVTMGDAGAFDYVVSSASTVKDAIDRATQFSRLVSDVLEIQLEFDGTLAVVRFDNDVSLPRAATDFQLGGFFRTHVAGWFKEALPEVVVSFNHAAPADLLEYKRTFGAAKGRFNAPHFSFSFSRHLLDTPLVSADRRLQELMVQLASRQLGQLSFVKTLTAEVRLLVAAQLQRGSPEVALVASRLGLSVRTLARRLEREGTTFRTLVNDARRHIGLEYVGKGDLPLAEISSRLGFAHGAAFHRAFRRWTGRTPLDYRRSRGR